MSTERNGISAPQPLSTRPSRRPESIVGQVLALVLAGDELNLRGVSGREEDPNVVCSPRVDLTLAQERVVEALARRPEAAAAVYAVRDGYGHVEDGVMLLAVEAKVLADRDVVGAAAVVSTAGLAVANQAFGPGPVDVLDGAPGLLRHDEALAAGYLGAAVVDRQVQARVPAVEEHGDVVDLRRALGHVWRQVELAVGRHVQRHM
ncbi:hypothetical protein PspLS_04844 [Pyricularia sp. CBS 133598]|nr:hypothetical protein PspLS_04844 [Pyricularia sp. CBS 133598]